MGVLRRRQAQSDPHLFKTMKIRACFYWNTMACFNGLHSFTVKVYYKARRRHSVAVTVSGKLDPCVVTPAGSLN